MPGENTLMKSLVPIIPAKYPCYKHTGMCQLRQWADSKFECVKERPEYCQWREKPKDKNKT